MKAAVLEAIDTLTVREVPDPKTPAGGAVIRVKSCAVCGSDIRIVHSGNSRVVPPRIIGHEIAGEVVSVADGVTRLRVGDRVAVGADVPCGECAFCEAGIGNNCQINYAMGYQFDGGFAQYLALNATVVSYGPVHRLPGHVSFDEGALAEPLGCVLNALELTPVKLNDTVALIGAGPIGMMLCDVARMMGASRVILINRSMHRLEIARSLGVADVYVCTAGEDAVARVLTETGGLGADVLFTSCPSPQAQIDALRMAKNRARINFFGGLPRDRSVVPLDTNIIHYKELLVSGAHGAMPVHHGRALELIGSGRMDIGKYITHHFDLEDIHAAFAAAEGHAGLRVMVHPS